MDSSIFLKACPFCTSNNLSVHEQIIFSWHKWKHLVFQITCFCGCEGPMGKSHKEACDKWNTR